MKKSGAASANVMYVWMNVLLYVLNNKKLKRVALCHQTFKVWALKPPSWALVHKTTYAPMIYTALCIVFRMHA